MTLRLTSLSVLYLCAGWAQLSSGHSPFLGGIPSAPAAATPLALTLEDAIGRGLRQNLGLFLGEQGTRSAQAARLNARSGLLPNVSAGVSDIGQQINLQAFGFPSFPGIAPIIGPFNVFDARVSVSQAVVNLTSLTAGENPLGNFSLILRNLRFGKLKGKENNKSAYNQGNTGNKTEGHCKTLL